MERLRWGGVVELYFPKAQRSRDIGRAVELSAKPGRARLGAVQLGSARLGSARPGSALLGSARLGPARLGSAQRRTAAP